MGRHVVAGVCAAAWVGAVWLIVRLRGTERVDRPLTGPPGWGRVARVTARVAGTVAGGLAAGALVLGLGGRLMMRVLAATSTDRAQGRLTDAEEVVGEVTTGGTVGLLVFVGLGGGLVGAALFAALRRWLPDRSLVAGLLAGGIGAGLVARPSGLVDPDNRDFALLAPSWLAVALCLGLLLTFALLGAVLIDRWARAWPVPGRSFRGVAGLLPLAPLVLVPPAAAGVLAVIGFRSAVGTGDTAPAGRADALLRGVVVLASVAGGAWTLAAAAEILAA